MRKLFGTLFVACILAIAPAQAQFGYGIKAGMNFSGKPTNIKGIVDEHTGWYAGPMVKFIFPVVGLGCEANLLYSNTGVNINNEVFNKHSIEIPLYLRYELSLPAIKKFFIPFAAVGPQWGYAFSENEFGTRADNTENRYFKFRKDCFSLNVGLGFVLFKHLQVHANYNIALQSNSEYLDNSTKSQDEETVKSRNNIWQISLAYLF